MTTDLPRCLCGHGESCHACSAYAPAVDALRDDLKALADVRTLDSWVLAEKGRWMDVDSDAPGLSCVLHDQTPDGDWDFDGSTPDEARAKAAAWVRGLR